MIKLKKSDFKSLCRITITINRSSLITEKKNISSVPPLSLTTHIITNVRNDYSERGGPNGRNSQYQYRRSFSLSLSAPFAAHQDDYINSFVIDPPLARPDYHHHYQPGAIHTQPIHAAPKHKGSKLISATHRNPADFFCVLPERAPLIFIAEAARIRCHRLSRPRAHR